MNEKEREIIEGYRKSLTALHELKRRKERERAPDRQMRVIYAEIEEVEENLRHLLKGASRFKWQW